MSNIWISAKQTHVAGPQAQSVTETQKAQISTFGVSSIGYGAGTGVSNSQTAPAEPNSAQISSFAVSSLTYTVNVSVQTAPTEPNSFQISTFAVNSLTYA